MFVVRGQRSRFMLAAGITFFLLGALFMADRLGYLVMKTSYVWPLVVVAVGVAILTGRMKFSVSWKDSDSTSEQDGTRFTPKTQDPPQEP